jgi:hypothetical protein
MRRRAPAEYLRAAHEKHDRRQEKKDKRNQTKIIDERHQQCLPLHLAIYELQERLNGGNELLARKNRERKT